MLVQEIYYYVGCGDIIRNDDRTSESTSVKIKDSGNRELTDALTTGDGPLVNGCQPNVRVNNEAGEKELLAASQMEEALKKGAEARKNAIALSALEYSGDLPKQLLTFSSKMEAVYKCLQELRRTKNQHKAPYQKHFNIIQEKLAWYEKAEATTWWNGLGPLSST
eukprot:Skav230026  [mRNA]  locus=scaffold261:117229:118063:- [translate_table: standard]